jgi:hypothetical protein
MVPQILSEDVYDPRNWRNLDNKGQDILIEKGHVKELNLQFLQMLTTDIFHMLTILGS